MLGNGMIYVSHDCVLAENRMLIFNFRAKPRYCPISLSIFLSCDDNKLL